MWSDDIRPPQCWWPDVLMRHQVGGSLGGFPPSSYTGVGQTTHAVLCLLSFLCIIFSSDLMSLCMKVKARGRSVVLDNDGREEAEALDCDGV